MCFVSIFSHSMSWLLSLAWFLSVSDRVHGLARAGFELGVQVFVSLTKYLYLGGGGCYYVWNNSLNFCVSLFMVSM